MSIGDGRVEGGRQRGRCPPIYVAVLAAAHGAVVTPLIDEGQSANTTEALPYKLCVARQAIDD